MVLSDMEDGSFLDVINENDLFGNAVGPDDEGNSGFNWADEFLSTTGVDDNAANTHVVQNETISPVEVVPLSIQNHITVQQNVVNAQSYLAQSSAMPAQGVPRSSSLGGMQIVQGATGLVQQTAATPQTQQINMSTMGQLQPGLGQQIVQGPNGQLILKPGGGGQIFFQTHPQIQSLQSGSSQASSLQQVPASSQVINRILAPNQSPVSTSPIVSRAITPVTSSHVGRSLTPIQSWAGVNPVSMVTNNANTQQVFTRNIPIQFNNTNAGIQLQGQSAVLQQGQGTILQQGQGQNTILQPTQGSNTLLHQGQGQTAAVLQGQGQNIVNTQNTVIQNPNVVNLNVAHVLCNNSQLQNQSGSTVHHMAPNIQGTLIQTADGKHIIIPNNSVPQTVGGQSINFQNLPQMTIQPQLNIAQNTSSGSNMVFGSTSNLAGNLTGNVIRLATPAGSATPTPTPTQDKTNQPQQPSHYIGVNQQGQQILIQRTQNTAGQQQNIILRTLNPNIVQLSQQQQQLQTASGIQTAPQIAGTPGTQQVLVTSQAQGIQVQRIVNTTQGQQVKLISHGGGQAAGMPLTINWPGMQNATNSAIPTAIQVVPQQQAPKTINSSSDGSEMSVHQQPTSSQVGMVLNSQSITVKSISNQNQYIQQQSQTQSTTPRKTVYSTPSSSKISLSSASATPQPKDITTHTSSHHLNQNQSSVQVPLVSQYSRASTTPNLSTASTTTVTTTLTQSRVPVTTTSQGSNQVMSSVQLQQLVAGANQKQNVLQARDSAPKLQHTSIQLTPEAQTQLQHIQENLKKFSGVKNLSNAQKVQQKHLQELQKKILSEGKIIRPAIQNTASPLTQHLIGQQTQQPVQFQTQALIGQNVQLIGQNQNVQSAPHLVIGQQLPKQIIGQTAVMKQEVASFQGSVKDPAQGTMGIVQSQQTPTQFVQATVAGSATPAGNLVIKTEAMSTPSLSTLIASSQVSPSISASLTQPTTSLPQSAKPGDVKTEPLDSAQDVSQLVTTGSTQVLMNQLPVGAVPQGVVMATAPPGKVPISASPKVALPTPIKIGNHTLNLNLTVEQKEKVQGYLSKMTPEQQQQQISLFLKLQRQQQLQAQVNAQVKAQQVLQQKQTLGPGLTSTNSKLPITVQKLDKVATATKPAELPPLTTVSTATTTTVPGLRIPFAAIPKSQLIHQQMSKDQDNALKPDTKSPFRSRRDTYRRLLRYHVFQCKSPPEDLMEKDHEMFENVASGLVLKKQKMFDKFRLLLLKESMREKKTAEMVMIQRLMNEDLTETIKSEKELVKSDPDSFEPMPMKYLQKQESVKSEDVCMEEEEAMDISKVIKSEKNSESDTIEIKKEQTSRPCTPKVKLVIRSDGQNFTSSLAEDGSSDSNESSFHDNVNMDTSEVDHQNSSNSRSDDISKGLFGSPHLTNIKREPSNDESESMESGHWSDSNKPFKLYLETDRSDNSPVSNSDLDTGVYGNSSPSPMQNEISRSEYEVHSGNVGSPVASVRQNSNTPPYDMTGESVRHPFSNDNNCDNSVLGYHSNEKQPLCVNSFSEKDLYHSHPYPQQSDNSDKQSFKPSFMSDSKVPFSIESELFGREVEDMNHTKQQISSIGNEREIDSAVVDVGGFHQTQYEPISSPEVDHDESFSSLITHKVDSAYTIGMGEPKDTPHMSNSDLPFNVPSFSSARLDVEPRESVEDDEATTLYSDDSDKESDSQQELLKAQMESAINSIVSLNQDSSVHSPFALDHSKEFFNRHSYMTNPTTESESDTPGPSSPVQSETPEDEPMDDDLDAAVNSILM